MAFPFITEGEVLRKRRPALVVQADRYNRARDATILAAITSARVRSELPCKVSVDQDSIEGRRGGLRLDSVIDCQTLVTIPRQEIVHRLGSFSADFMRSVDGALKDALAIP